MKSRVMIGINVGVLSVFGRVTPLGCVRPSDILSKRSVKDAIVLYDTGFGLDRNSCSARLKHRHAIQCLYSGQLWEHELVYLARDSCNLSRASDPFDCEISR
jgi:hypothetical protein